MFIRHSLKNIARSWPKSALFFLLLTALGVTLCIGVSLTAAILGFLKECDETYTTIAVFEYIGVDYPDETRFDPDVGKCTADFDFAALAENPDVLGWDSNAVALGSIAGKTANSADPPYKNSIVAVVYILSYNEQKGAFQFSVVEDLINKGNERNSGYLDTSGAKLEIGRSYLIHGRFGSRLTGAGANPFVNIYPFHIASAERAGVDLSVDKMLLDVSTGGGNHELPTDSILYQIAETYKTVNTGVTVRATNDLDAFLPFHQSDLAVVSGRGFTAGEYANGAKVCILPERLAELLNVGVGAKIDLALAVQDGAPMRESYWAGTGFTYENDYTVVGIINPNDDYRDTVFIPKSSDTDLSANNFAYTLGQARLKNDRADHFYLDMKDKLPPRVRMTVYDQGYAAAAAPVRDVLRIAVIITAVCVLTAFAVLALFGFLFVYRQRGLVKTMRRVGAANRGIFSYFLCGSSCIALSGAVIGVLISINLSGYFMDIVRRTIADYSTSNLRYSNAVITASKTITFAPDIKLAVFILTGLALFLFAVFACFIFTLAGISAARGRRVKRGECRAGSGESIVESGESGDESNFAAGVKSHTLRGGIKPHTLRGGKKSHTLRGGTWKYAWLSVRRGASRSALPVVLCALAAALLLQLTGTTAEYEASYIQLIQDTDISAYITDSRGIWRYGLRIDGTVINDICNADILSGVSVIKSGIHYGYDLPQPEVWTPFTMETYLDMIASGPEFTYTNDLTAAQEFYGCTEIPVAFMDGYDMSFFSYIPPDDVPVEYYRKMDDFVWLEDLLYSPQPGIVSTDFLEKNGLEFGDVITVAAAPGGSNLAWGSKVVEIVGTFVKQGSADNIYVPLSFCNEWDYVLQNPNRSDSDIVFFSSIPSSYVFDTGADTKKLQKLSFNSVSLKMRGADGLDAFKDFLFDRGYSEVNTIRDIRSFITIEDKTFQAAERAMSQRLWYMQKIFPALYVLTELLAALIPFILIQLRKRESALMRVQGAAKHTAFFSVFWEQVMLCLPGVLIGAGIWLAVFGTPVRTGLYLALLFALLWLLGSGVSALALNRGSVRMILKAEE